MILIDEGISCFDLYILIMILIYRETVNPSSWFFCGGGKKVHLAQRVEVQLGSLVP